MVELVVLAHMNIFRCWLQKHQTALAAQRRMAHEAIDLAWRGVQGQFRNCCVHCLDCASIPMATIFNSTRPLPAPSAGSIDQNNSSLGVRVLASSRTGQKLYMFTFKTGRSVDFRTLLEIAELKSTGRSDDRWSRFKAVQ